jgi:hypothetical protein
MTLQPSFCETVVCDRMILFDLSAFQARTGLDSVETMAVGVSLEEEFGMSRD